MPKGIVQTPEEEECWTKAKELATEHFGRAPRHSMEWAYVTGIYRHMCHLQDLEEELDIENVEILERYRSKRPSRRAHRRP